MLQRVLQTIYFGFSYGVYLLGIWLRRWHWEYKLPASSQRLETLAKQFYLQLPKLGNPPVSATSAPKIFLMKRDRHGVRSFRGWYVSSVRRTPGQREIAPVQCPASEHE